MHVVKLKLIQLKIINEFSKILCMPELKLINYSNQKILKGRDIFKVKQLEFIIEETIPIQPLKVDWN